MAEGPIRNDVFAGGVLERIPPANRWSADVSWSGASG
jgi:hypothetical protein